MRIYPQNADNIHGTWIFPQNADNIHGVRIYPWNANNIHRMCIFPQNADNIHGTWIFPQNTDISTIIATTRTEYRNLTHNFITQLYSWHGTQHHKTLTPRPRQVLSPTWSWRPLPRCSPGTLYILHITVWFLRACVVFIQRLAFKNGDNFFGCRPLQIHFGHW